MDYYSLDASISVLDEPTTQSFIQQTRQIRINTQSST